MYSCVFRSRAAGLIRTAVAALLIFTGGLFLQVGPVSIPQASAETIESESGSFTGDIGNATTPGSGTFKFLSGEEYKGDWLDFQFDGIGEMNHPGSGVYSGSYTEGKRSGQGTFTWDNGDTYSGGWELDAFHGEGTYTFADGGKVTGTFDHGSIVDGMYFFTNETGKYVASYKLGEIVTTIVENDKGKYTFSYDKGSIYYASLKLNSGLAYEGGIKNGLVNGSGTLTYPNGNTYKGTFKNGKRSGSGVFKWTKKGASYNGKWSNDRMNGKGTYYYPKSAKGYKLVGKFKNGKPTGYCTYYVTKSRHYKTKWSSGKCVKIWE